MTTDELLEKFGLEKIYKDKFETISGSIFTFNDSLVYALESYLLDSQKELTISQYTNVILYLKYLNGCVKPTDDNFELLREFDNYLSDNIYDSPYIFIYTGDNCTEVTTNKYWLVSDEGNLVDLDNYTLYGYIPNLRGVVLTTLYNDDGSVDKIFTTKIDDNGRFIYDIPATSNVIQIDIEDTNNTDENEPIKIAGGFTVNPTNGLINFTPTKGSVLDMKKPYSQYSNMNNEETTTKYNTIATGDVPPFNQDENNQDVLITAKTGSNITNENTGELVLKSDDAFSYDYLEGDATVFRDVINFLDTGTHLYGGNNASKPFTYNIEIPSYFDAVIFIEAEGDIKENALWSFDESNLTSDIERDYLILGWGANIKTSLRIQNNQAESGILKITISVSSSKIFPYYSINHFQANAREEYKK